MMRSALQAVWRTLPPVGLLVLAGAAGARLARQPDVPSAVAVGAALVGAAVGAGARWRLGTLAMAWRCPRLDALGLEPAGVEGPWTVLRLAEGVLEGLDAVSRRFPEYFFDAQGAVLEAARRAVDVQRAQPAAPDALVRLEELLAQVRADLRAVLQPADTSAPELAIEELKERSGALVLAVAEVAEVGAPAKRQEVST